MSYDADEHVKEVFAHFGLAFYLSGIVEIGLAHALLTLNFLAEQNTEIERGGRERFDRLKFEAAFDAFLNSQYAKTLGNLLKGVRELAVLDDDLKALMTEVKARRDFLAHHFFREHAEDLGRRKGCDRMLAELKDAQELFQTADGQLSALTNRLLVDLGVSIEVIEAHVNDYIRSATSDEQGEEVQS